MTADFKAKKLTEFVPETERVEPKVEYKVYNERQVGMEFDVEWQNPVSAATLMIHVITIVNCRWWILGTVVLLNFANYAHWIAFPAVAKKVNLY